MQRRSDDLQTAVRQAGSVRTLPHLDASRPDTRVTIVRTGGLGDTILTLPALAILCEAYPHGTFTLVGSTWAEALQPLLPHAVRAVHIDRVFPLSRRGGGAANVFAASSAVVVYTAAPDSELVSYVRRTCHGPVVAWTVEPAPGTHAARHLAGAVAVATSESDRLPMPALRCPREERLQARTWLDREIGEGVRPLALHPGSGARRKCWPAHRFAELAARLQVPVLLVEGPADSAACRECVAAIPPSVHLTRATDVTLSRLAALLTESCGYIGNDSGVSHLAGALGVPTVAVFGPTDPAVWAPRGSAVFIVTARNDTSWPTVDEVLPAARTLLNGPQRGTGA